MTTSGDASKTKRKSPFPSLVGGFTEEQIEFLTENGLWQESKEIGQTSNYGVPEEGAPELDLSGSYAEIFDIEVDGWCYGISNYPGEIFPALIFRVVKELEPSFRQAVEHEVVFDLLDIATRISRAAKYLVDERDITFEILDQFPSPSELNEDQQFALAQLIDQAEQAYGGALEVLEKKWAGLKEVA